MGISKFYKLRGWHFQLALAVALGAIASFPIYRDLNRFTGETRIPRGEVVGFWYQEASADKGGERYALELRDDHQFIIYSWREESDVEVRFSGPWAYSSEEIGVMGLNLFGFRNWIRFYNNIDSEPQFFLRREGGVNKLFRGIFASEISADAFLRDSNGSIEDRVIERLSDD